MKIVPRPEQSCQTSSPAAFQTETLPKKGPRGALLLGEAPGDPGRSGVENRLCSSYRAARIKKCGPAAAIQSCYGDRQLPSCARLGRTNASVPTQPGRTNASVP